MLCIARFGTSIAGEEQGEKSMQNSGNRGVQGKARKALQRDAYSRGHDHV